MFNNILLAVDGSDHSLNAARTASQLARTLNSAELRIVVVYDSVPPFLGEPNFQSAINARLDEAQGILRKAEQLPALVLGMVAARLALPAIPASPTARTSSLNR